MSIEWLPRRQRDGNGWREPRRSAAAGPARLGQLATGPGVVVPVTRVEASLRRAPGWARQTALGVSVGTAGLGLENRVVELLALCMTLGGMNRAGRQLLVNRRRPSLALTPTTLYAGELALPWSVVEAVVSFSLKGVGGEIDSSGRRVWNHLAVRVSDFDNVAGLSPVRAGLANLTRRRLVLLCDAVELRAPLEVAAALQHLVDHPEARLLLSGHEGVRLLTEGPPGGF